MQKVVGSNPITRSTKANHEGEASIGLLRPFLCRILHPPPRRGPHVHLLQHALCPDRYDGIKFLLRKWRVGEYGNKAEMPQYGSLRTCSGLQLLVG